MNFRMPTTEEIYAAIERGKEAVVELFAEVGRQVEELAGQLEKQAEVLKELQNRLSKNSRNSNKPPSFLTIADQINPLNVHNYIGLPDGVRVANVRRIR